MAKDSSLYQFECRQSDDDVKTDLELTCTDCDKVLCDIEAGDNLGTLTSVASEHVCEKVGPDPDLLKNIVKVRAPAQQDWDE